MGILSVIAGTVHTSETDISEIGIRNNYRHTSAMCITLTLFTAAYSVCKILTNSVSALYKKPACCRNPQRRFAPWWWRTVDERGDGRFVDEDSHPETVSAERRLPRLVLPRAGVQCAPYDGRRSADLWLQVVDSRPSGTGGPGHRLQSSCVEYVVVNRRRRDHFAAWFALLPPGAAASLVVHRFQHHEPTWKRLLAWKRLPWHTNLPRSASNCTLSDWIDNVRTGLIHSFIQSSLCYSWRNATVYRQ